MANKIQLKEQLLSIVEKVKNQFSNNILNYRIELNNYTYSKLTCDKNDINPNNYFFHSPLFFIEFDLTENSREIIKDIYMYYAKILEKELVLNTFTSCIFYLGEKEKIDKKIEEIALNVKNHFNDIVDISILGINHTNVYGYMTRKDFNFYDAYIVVDPLKPFNNKNIAFPKYSNYCIEYTIDEKYSKKEEEKENFENEIKKYTDKLSIQENYYAFTTDYRNLSLEELLSLGDKASSFIICNYKTAKSSKNLEMKKNCYHKLNELSEKIINTFERNIEDIEIEFNEKYFETLDDLGIILNPLEYDDGISLFSIHILMKNKEGINNINTNICNILNKYNFSKTFVKIIFYLESKKSIELKKEEIIHKMLNKFPEIVEYFDAGIYPPKTDIYIVDSSSDNSEKHFVVFVFKTESDIQNANNNGSLEKLSNYFKELLSSYNINQNFLQYHLDSQDQAKKWFGRYFA